MGIFTKLFKPVYSTLHNQGHISMGYIDDSYLQGDTKDECRMNAKRDGEQYLIEGRLGGGGPHLAL